MSGSTSVPDISFTATGFVPPAQSAIVAGAAADWNAALGGNVNPAPTTPQGQLVSSQSAIIGDSYGQQCQLFNTVDPAFAFGRMQDAIGRIYYIYRNPAQSTVLQVICSGLVGVQIPVGAAVVDPNQNVYLCTGAGTIGSGGSVTLSFAAAVPGPLAVPSSVAISQSIVNWSSATLVSGVIGNDVESRAAFEARRAASVAVNGFGFPGPMGGAVAQVPGVLDWYVYSNNTAAPVTIQGMTIAANAIYVCVAGGASAAVAQAIFSKLNPGPPMTGNTTVTVSDSNSGYSLPYPTYSITFEIPVGDAICMNVVIKNSSIVPANAAALIQAQITAAFLGQISGGPPRARIGSEIFALQFVAAATAAFAGCQVISITLGDAAASAATFTGVIAGTTLTVSSVTGTIAIGQFVYSVGVETTAAGTIIVSGSGTSWVVAVSQTVSSVSMISVAATLAETTININAIPTLAGADINVTLGS